METIHLKTVDPISQRLLSSASQQGLQMVWERFEKSQPQDGFMRLGLCCPYECMHGPCRIDPFGRGAATGICGMDREQMVAGMLLNLCQRGVLEALGTVPQDNLSYSDTLTRLAEKNLSGQELPELSAGEILKSTAALRRSARTCEDMVQHSLRLGLMTLGLVEQVPHGNGAGTLSCRTGYGIVADGSVRIGFCGQPSPDVINSFHHAVGQAPEPSTLLASLGEWLQMDEGFMPIAASSGEAELLLSSGAIDLLVAGPGTDPAMMQLCSNLDIPVVVDGSSIDVDQMLLRARTRSGRSSQQTHFAAATVQPHDVIMSEQQAQHILTSAAAPNIAFVGGSDTPHLPLGKLPVELASELSGSGLQLAGWGDAALWMSRYTDDSAESAQPVATLENRQGPLLGVKALARSGQLDSLQGICFTGLKSCTEFSLALGLAYLGCRVSIATPVPLLGSKTVCSTLTERVEANGGELLIFDHPPRTEELSEWFINR